MQEMTDKDRLARRGDYGQEAAALRMRACRKMSGLGQEALGVAVGLTKSAISNVENAMCFPSRQLMAFYYREYKVDFNFLIAGEYAHLPTDVQERVFTALSAYRQQTEDATCR